MSPPATSVSTVEDEWFELVVQERCEPADGVACFELAAADGSSLPKWTPGAHIDLRLPGGLVRQYSLCGEPWRADRWRIAVLREPDSRGGSRWIHRWLGTGDRVQAAGARNHFELVDAADYLFVAGGIGITPILPMVRAVAALGRPWQLLYGGRTRSSMAFLPALAAIGGGALHVVPQDRDGHPDLDRFLGIPAAGTAIYCCGPAGLLDAVERRSASWAGASLHTERFAPRAGTGTGDGGFEVVLARSGERLPVPPEHSLLEVLEAAGVEVTNSCRAGICGTCLIPVLDGLPEHNDDVLTDAERDGNDVMLPCVSRALSAELVLDL